MNYTLVPLPSNPLNLMYSIKCGYCKINLCSTKYSNIEQRMKEHQLTHNENFLFQIKEHIIEIPYYKKDCCDIVKLKDVDFLDNRVLYVCIKCNKFHFINKYELIYAHKQNFK